MWRYTTIRLFLHYDKSVLFYILNYMFLNGQLSLISCDMPAFIIHLSYIENVSVL